MIYGFCSLCELAFACTMLGFSLSLHVPQRLAKPIGLCSMGVQ